jgi:ABC-type branched-subunit amino acid transport system ATPase component
MSAILSVQGLSRFFGGLAAVSDLDFEVQTGEILSLIGPNGAGKTTVFNLITGTLLPSRGRIQFFEKDITGLRPHETAGFGIARTFQTTTLFPDEAVLDNLMMGYRCRTRMGIWDALFQTGRSRDDERKSRQKAEEILEFISLADRASELAKNIPQESQKRLAVGLALATEPKMLLLDEPMGGLTEEENVGMMRLIEKIRGQGISILLIEHKMKVVMKISDRIVVLNYGRKIAQGPPEGVSRNPEVIEAYLGAGYGE